MKLIAHGARFNNLGNVEDRLERIEVALSSLTDGLHRMEMLQEGRDSLKDDLQDLGKVGILHGQVLRDIAGHEHYFSPISLASLMWEAHCIVDARNALTKSSLRSQPLLESSRQLLECCNEINACDQLDLSHDGLLLVLPPRFILDATVGPFFSDIHGLMPIFNRQNFDANLEMLYTGRSTGSDRAWTMCFNNIVLLALMPKTIQSQQHHTHMDEGLVKSFIDNFRRGYQYLDEFLRPTLCNVQVLITMVSSKKEKSPIERIERCPLNNP